MKKITLIAGLLAASAVAYAQEAPKFSDVDTDMNGELSFAEANAAWPALMLTDDNQDGQANRAEIVAKIPGLVFSVDAEEAQYVIDAFDYEDIVKAMNSKESASE